MAHEEIKTQEDSQEPDFTVKDVEDLLRVVGEDYLKLPPKKRVALLQGATPEEMDRKRG